MSILPFGGKVEKITLKGFYYPLNEYQMQADEGLGISNEIVDEEAEISLGSGRLIVVESKD